MEEKYIPPYEITDEMLEIVSEIMENLGKLNGVNELQKLPVLRKVNRIKSIHSSLAIENNTLTVEQVTDVINGKRVFGPKEDILAVHNANYAYQELSHIHPYEMEDLLRIHGIMMKDLVIEAGQLRTGQVGVYDQEGTLIHLAPPAELVPNHLQKLFEWLKDSQVHMLIKSSVFHYEFEFIHPFRDGNGRTGRLWQTALLAYWKPIFAWIPIESMIKEHQEEYYEAIRLSTIQGKSNAFILFMLGVINQVIKNLVHDTKRQMHHVSRQVTALLEVMESYPQSAKELMERLQLKSLISFRKNYLNPALQLGLIEMTEPDKPTSRNQKYFKI